MITSRPPHRGSWRLTLLLFVALCLPAGVGCRRQPTQTGQSDDAPALRVVSLSPHLTQILVDLGAAETLVGIGEHDHAAPSKLPVVGTYSDVRVEALLAVRPTHILTVRGRHAPPARLEALARERGWHLLAYPYPDTITAIADAIASSMPTSPPSVAEVVGRPEAGRQLRERLDRTLEALQRVTAPTASAPPPRVLLAFGLEPVGASGPGSVLDALLPFLGARNALADATVSYVELNREGVLAARPDLLLLLRPGEPPLSGPNDPRLRSLRGLAYPGPDRIQLLNHPLSLLPSSSLIEVAPALARSIHPDRVEAIDRAMAPLAHASETAASEPALPQRPEPGAEAP